MPLTALHHVQLAMPAGQENRARRFYIDILGFEERPKPAILAARGGLWLAHGTTNGPINLHLGVEDDFRAARKAHPAFLANDLDEIAARFAAADIAVTWDNDLPDFRRFYVDDPFGNRIEIMERDNTTNSPDGPR